MPRTARVKSESGIYHAMLRGINRQQIFEDNEDYEKFLQVLAACKKVSQFKLYAYCLMGNHIHLLLQPEKEPIDLIFKRIGSRFVYWYNDKYRRTGHLFQDRYKSQAVEDEHAFLAVIRYIHQNPVKAGICPAAKDYFYSSYQEYAGNCRLIDTEFLQSIAGEELLQFIDQPSDDIPYFEDTPHINDRDGAKLICQLSGCDSPQQVQHLPLTQRNTVIAKLHRKGLSIRQLSRLTGISFNIVRKYCS